MADSFLDTDSLVAAVEAADFDRPPALVANAHITGVSVARALAARDVPVIALDRNGDGYAPPSDAVAFAGEVTYPLDDLDGFRRDVERVADAAGVACVAFPCMDDWVRGFAETEPDGVVLPFSDHDGIERVLDKDNLYRRCEELGVPYPETHRLDGHDDRDAAVDAAVDALGFPLVVKPAHKRKFEEAFGTNVIEVDGRDELDRVVADAAAADATVLLQEKVNVEVGADASFGSYVSPDGDALGVVANAAVRFPREFGTSCLVETVDEPAVRDRALAVLEATDYHGISESEFVYDVDREEYVLLDINTRPWKWVSMPVQAGANLPLAAYRDAVADLDAADVQYDPGEPGEARWVYLRDYLELCLTDSAFWDVLSRDDWTALLSGDFEADDRLTTGLYRPSDPAPAAKLLDGEFTDRDYYCSC
ncbi:carboxylate--amine ligase [Halobaculum sp. D14]|uniref:carboxylate--amine ligase n=1 Tax=Halobaculum sp. D14 TaxID=3421642 RepID=UPI003EC12F21